MLLVRDNKGMKALFDGRTRLSQDGQNSLLTPAYDVVLHDELWQIHTQVNRTGEQQRGWYDGNAIDRACIHCVGQIAKNDELQKAMHSKRGGKLWWIISCDEDSARCCVDAKESMFLKSSKLNCTSEVDARQELWRHLSLSLSLARNGTSGKIVVSLLSSSPRTQVSE